MKKEQLEKEITKILHKNFRKTNKEGMGFLNVEMDKCHKDLVEFIQQKIQGPYMKIIKRQK